MVNYRGASGCCGGRGRRPVWEAGLGLGLGLGLVLELG